ncbi:hypothetical protein [Kibdelosporangium philippinense]|uniref:hypothetical protein n=1 Tax=Kibdelosporangium philippinense TaxID=211113 RepID=UPI003612FA03
MPPRYASRTGAGSPSIIFGLSCPPPLVNCVHADPSADVIESVIRLVKIEPSTATPSEPPMLRSERRRARRDTEVVPFDAVLGDQVRRTHQEASPAPITRMYRLDVNDEVVRSSWVSNNVPTAITAVPMIGKVR